MKSKSYLPCWANDMSFQDLYAVCWIMGNNSPAEKLFGISSFYSLLPIRFYNGGDWNYVGQYDLHSVGTYKDGYELCRSSNIRSSKAEFALKLWEASAEELLCECPDILELEFGDQNENGIYQIFSKYSYTFILERQKAIMNDMIARGFSVDEYMNITYSEENDGRNRKNWHYEGVVGLSEYELSEMFYKSPHGEKLPIDPKMNVKYSYDECEEYYKTFSEYELLLGNQRRAYAFYADKNKPIFDAVSKADLLKTQDLLNKGYYLNEINTYGETAFSILVSNLIDEDLTDESKAILEKLLDSGANPSLFGVHPYVDSIIFYAAFDGQSKLVEWLLNSGVNPYIPIHLDYPFSDYENVIDWIEDHSDEFDFCGENNPHYLETRKVLDVFKAQNLY